MTRSIFILLVFAGALSGCGLRPAGNTTPLQVHPDMDSQPKYKAQAASIFFADGRANRAALPGTIAQGHLGDDEVMNTGKDASGNFIKTNPVTVTDALIKHGQERYNINCAPCHGRLGDGNGAVKARSFGALNPANLQQPLFLSYTDGQIFDVITNGKVVITNGQRTQGLMQPLGGNIPVDDRWAIVAYVRALQRSQNAGLKDVPDSEKNNIKAADPSATPIATAAPATGASPATSPAAAPSAAGAASPAKAAAPTKK